MTTYVTPAQVRRMAQIHSSTLRKWAESGLVNCIRMPGGKRLYDRQQLQLKLLGRSNADKQKAKVIYTRVSSQHQKEDLERQIQDLKQAYPEHEVVKDIASGLNWKRPGLRALLERCYSQTVSEIVVAYRDRLCRFGLELLEWIFQKYDVKLVVHNKMDAGPESSSSAELAEDLLAVTNFFVAKNNGQRAAQKRCVYFPSYVLVSSNSPSVSQASAQTSETEARKRAT